MGALYTDIRFALRTLLRSRLFTCVAVLSLALGIGANTAIFTLLDQLILRSLPVKQPEQLVMIWSTGPHMGNNRGPRASSYPMYREFQQKASAFSYVFCRFFTPLSVSFDNRTERVNAELVSGNYFDALSVKPAIGRVFSPEQDDRVYKGHPAVVLSHDYWTSRFNADPGVVGRKILVNNYPMVIVGVSAAGFSGLDPSTSPEIRVPIQMKPLMTAGWDDLGNRRSQWIHTFARMKPGFTLQSAKASLQPLFHQILEQEVTQDDLPKASQYYRDRFLKRTVLMESAANGYSQLRQQVSTALIVLMCMVGLVLAIACFNVANLLIARAVARQKEIAVRLALGASRGQLVHQLLVESLILSVAGGLLGIALSVWTIRGLLGFVPSDGSPLLLRAEPDARILAFNVALAILTGLLFGLAPALQSTRFDTWNTLKDAVGSIAGSGRTVTLRKALVIAQVALSFLLLVGAGLFLKSLANLKNTHTGFTSLDNLITFQVDPSLNGYSVPRMQSFYKQIAEQIRNTPGVKSAAYAIVPLLHGDEWDSSMSVEGHMNSVEGHMNKDGEDVQAFMNSVSPGYFKTLGIPILEGRDFDGRDVGPKMNVAIVNREFAQHFFGERSPIGRHIGFDSGPDTKLPMEIVGVAENTLYEGPRQGVHRQVFVANPQTDFPAGVAFYVRTSLGSAAMFGALRQQVRNLDAALPVYEMKTLEKQLDETLNTERLIALLSAAFGVLATLLAALGLYGVMAFVVERRTKELGLRMALGARQSEVLWLVLREMLLLFAIGLAIGVPSAYALSRYVSSQLFGVKPTDPWTAASALVVLGIVTLAAGLLPARRASNIDPIRALRYE
jgi:predicted permease